MIIDACTIGKEIKPFPSLCNIYAKTKIKKRWEPKNKKEDGSYGKTKIKFMKNLETTFSIFLCLTRKYG